MNNTAEYEGLLAGLRIATDLGIKKLIVRGDSQLVVRQVNKNYQSPLMEAYVDEVRKLEEHFDGLQMEHVPRAQNDIACHIPSSGLTYACLHLCIMFKFLKLELRNLEASKP